MKEPIDLRGLNFEEGYIAVLDKQLTGDTALRPEETRYALQADTTQADWAERLGTAIISVTRKAFCMKANWKGRSASSSVSFMAGCSPCFQAPAGSCGEQR